VRVVPSRLSAVPALLAGALRPDLLVTGLVSGVHGWHFGSEVSWQRGLMRAGVPCLAVHNRLAPLADAGTALAETDGGGIDVLGEVADAPVELTRSAPDPDVLRICARVATLVPAGARIQVGPGRLGAALLDALEVPVHLDSGLLPDAVLDLGHRGLLLGTPVASYLAGSARLYDWAANRRLLHPLEFTHDPGRLGEPPPLVAVNTAVQVDLDGQVNVEGFEHAPIGGIGGHPDFAAAAVRSVGGISVIALRSKHGSRSTLVRRLDVPVTTPSQDVQVVVTELGIADLRGLDRAERRGALRAVFTEVG
ncbi:MAG: acetyl-CoA hydrolase/transferase C-terminal domain-containing protein, partial [Sciscionella sp.]